MGAPEYAEFLALAARYAPVLYFHPDEHNFLQDPLTYIDESSLRQELDFRPDRELHGEGDVPPSELATIGAGNQDADSQIFLDHSDGKRAGDLDNSVNLYQYDPATNTITYHFFYSYNDGPRYGLGGAQNHEGDWEKITIQLDANYQPTEVRYSDHDGMDIARSWADAPKENGRPVSYVAQGSHANYPEPGRWETGFPGADDAARADGIRFDLAGRPPVDVTQESYYGGYALWGERGSLQEFGSGITTGPTGPSATKGPILHADPGRQPIPEGGGQRGPFGLPVGGPVGLPDWWPF